MDGEGEILKMKTEVYENSNKNVTKSSVSNKSSKQDSLKELLSIPNIQISEKARNKIIEFTNAT